MEIRTHRQIDSALCGRPSSVEPGRAEVVLETTSAMVVDAEGLVHGGFVFGAVDHAAMLAVNDPYVVLAGADVRFLAPVAVGDRVVARATVRGDREGAPDGAEGAARPPDQAERPDRPHRPPREEVEVVAVVGERTVLSGVLRCAVLDGHVLAGRRTSEAGDGKGAER
jgi:acyl-coenzyme A thioesterase PaaI-like protein